MKIGLISLWFVLFLISINHLFSFFSNVIIPTRLLGLMGWLTLLATLLFLSAHFIKPVLIIFFLFFFLGYSLGPYLEPPADPIDHLKRTYYFYGKNTRQISKKNRGFWHYSMSISFLGSTNGSTGPESILRKIDALHGIYWGILMTGLFILSKSAGFPNRWAFLSALIAFLFFGTNRFSYFSYYSLAPSFFSILIYWLWTAVFFFKRDRFEILLGLIMAGMCMPILWVNHIQEAVFLGFIVVVWLFFNFSEKAWHVLNKHRKEDNRVKTNPAQNRLLKIKVLKGLTKNRKNLILSIYLIGFLFLFFALPQFHWFQQFMSAFFEKNLWHTNQAVVYSWRGIHLFGKIWSFRINETLGLMGFLPALLAVFYFWPKLLSADRLDKNRIFLLGLLPLLGYGLPLFHFIWVSNNKIPTYYRLSYASMFWLPVALFIYDLENRSSRLRKKLIKINHLKSFEMITDRGFKAFFFAGCLAIIVLISSIRAGPVYGKLDFILLETRPWWTGWRPMIQRLMQEDRKTIYSDPQTSAILQGVFNLPTLKTISQRGGRDFNFIPKSIIKLASQDTRRKINTYKCVINLRGFSPSWVPIETGHWQKNSARTSLYYDYNGIRGDKLKAILKENPPEHCQVYY